jgi:hypothetical protein
MSFVLSLVIVTTHAGLLSEDTPRSARLVDTDSRVLLAQESPPPPPPPLPPPGAPYQYAPAPSAVPRANLVAEREDLMASMPSLVAPIVLIGVGAAAIITSYFLFIASVAGITPALAIIGLVALIGGIAMVAVGTPLLIVAIIKRGKTQRRINAIDRELKQPGYPATATPAPAEWLPLASLAF